MKNALPERIWYHITLSAPAIVRCSELQDADALDVASECFLSVLKALGAPTGPSLDDAELKKYVATALWNAVKKERSRRKRASQLDPVEAERLPGTTVMSPSEVVLRSNLLVLLNSMGEDGKYASQVVMGLRELDDPKRLLRGAGELANALRATLNWKPGEFWRVLEALLEEQARFGQAFTGRVWGPQDLDNLAPWWTIDAVQSYPRALAEAGTLLGELRKNGASWRAAADQPPSGTVCLLVAQLLDLLERRTGFVVVRTGGSLSPDELRCFVLMVGSHLGTNLTPDIGDARPLFSIEVSKSAATYAGNGRNAKDIPFHSDGSGVGRSVDYLCLACIRQAVAGGHTRISNAFAAYCSLPPTIRDYLTREFPRQDPYNPNRPATALTRAPIFKVRADGVRFSYHPQRVRNGLRKCSTSAEGLKEAERALAALDAALEEQGYDILLKPGDLLILQNSMIAHGRRAFDPSAGRLLERYWAGRT